MNLVRKQRISVIKIIFHNLQQKINQNFFHSRKLRPAKNKNKFRKLRTITQNQFNFRPAEKTGLTQKFFPFFAENFKNFDKMSFKHKK